MSCFFHRATGAFLVSLFATVASTEASDSALEQLRVRFAAIAATAQGRVGVAARLLETGEGISLHGSDRFPMQSVYKLPIAMAVLRQVETGRLHLDQRVRVEPAEFLSARQHSPIRDHNPTGVELSIEELLRFMVQESDGTACDVLLRLNGGPDVVTSYLRDLGISDVVVATTEREMGADEQVQYRNWSTPDGMVAVLRAVHEGRGISADHRARLLRWMTETTTGQHRLKAQLPAGTVVTHKTGSSRTIDGLTRATNDAGLITLPDGNHLAMAVFVSDSTTDDASREGVIAQLALAAWQHWAGD